jgi:flagellar motor switch protein FliG
MCTKWFSDGDVHKYFNPYNTPYEAFINYMNILSDFLIRIGEMCPGAFAGENKTEQKPVLKEVTKEPAKKIISKEIISAKAETTIREKSSSKKKNVKSKNETIGKVKKIEGKLKEKTGKKVAKKINKVTKSLKTKAIKKNKIPKVRGSELNVFANISKKTIKDIFSDFDIKILAKALISAESEIEEKVKTSLGQRLSRKLKTAMGKILAPTSAEIKDARKIIEEQIRKYFAEKK